MAERFPRARVARTSEHWPHRTVGDLFARTVARQPAQVALIDGPERIEFAELDCRVDALAHRLRALGVGAGDVVAYQLPNWWEAVVVFLATAELGAIANPLLPAFREAELRHALFESGARVAFIPGSFRGCDHRDLLDSLGSALPVLEHVIVCRDTPGARFRTFDDLIASSPGAAISSDRRRTPSEQRLPTSDALLLLMYTSGSTSAPKGVLHTHDTLAAEILSLARVHQLGADDRTLMPSPLTHISGVIHAILTPAILGTSAVLMERWEAGEGLRLIAAERVTYMVGAPIFLQEMVQHPRTSEHDTSSLRLFSCGGAAVTPELVRQARTLFPSCVAKRVYGSTEFPTLSTTSADDALTHGIETEGRAIAPAEIRIVRDDGTTASVGEEGEVQARGPECFVGYADAALDDDAFTADGWFRTGDLGTLDASGYLRITGRLKQVIIRKGEKISIRELEDAIAAHPAVAAAAVVALPDATTGECACVAVVLHRGASLTLADLGAFLSARGLARQKHPERLEVLDALPTTESGKVAKPALVKLLQV